MTNGWKCPGCGRCFAPWVAECRHCKANPLPPLVPYVPPYPHPGTTPYPPPTITPQKYTMSVEVMT